MDAMTLTYRRWGLVKFQTYSGVGFTHSLEETEMESGNSWGSNLLLVLVKPEVVSSIRSQVVLLSVQVIVVHF